MKRIKTVFMLCFLLCAFDFQRAKAQGQDLQQLLLDIEKLMTGADMALVDSAMH